MLLPPYAIWLRVPSLHEAMTRRTATRRKHLTDWNRLGKNLLVYLDPVPLSF